MDRGVTINNLGTGTLVYKLRGQTSSIISLVTLPNDYLASGSTDSTIKIWNPNTGSLVYTLTGHTNQVRTLVTLLNINLAYGSADVTVKIWNHIFVY